jgi:thiol-disulfide isomerase/thioredoxin
VSQSLLAGIFIIVGIPALSASRAITLETIEHLEPGEFVEPFNIDDVDGDLHSVEFPKGRITVLLFFSSGCPACHQMIPIWNRAFERRAKNVSVVGIVIDTPPPRFFERVTVTFPVMLSPGRGFLDRLKVARVPLTLRVAPGGRVEDVGIGSLDVIRVGQLFRP